MKKETKGCRENPRSMPNSEEYRNNWDRIFKKKSKENEFEEEYIPINQLPMDTD